MPAPSVQTTVEDQSTRVNAVGTYNSAIVIAAKKGPIDTPIKVSSQTDFLRRFAPNEKLEIGYDNAYYEAYRYLEEQNGLYVVRAAHTIDLEDTEEDWVARYGACVLVLDNNTNSHIPLSVKQANLPINEQGLINPESYTFGEGEAALIYGADPGAYNNNISLTIITDQSQVKCEGAFLINVYKNDILVEGHIVSLDPQLKNGYGVTCDIEQVLQSSNYIRAFKNADDFITTTSYELEVQIDTITNGDVTATTYVTAFANEAWVEAADGSNVKKDTDGNILYRYIAMDNIYKTKYCQQKFRQSTRAITDADIQEDPSISGLRYTAYYREPEKTYTIYRTAKASERTYRGYTRVWLTGGNDGSEVLTSDRIRALNTLGNLNNVNIQLVLDGGYTTVEYQNAIANLCDKREKSCHGIISTPYQCEIGGISGDALTDIQQYRNYDLNLANYSVEMYSPHQKYYDEFNDRYLYLSPGPYVASLIMQTAQERGWHWAVAGYNRGIVNSLDVAVPYEPLIVNELSDIQVNTIVKDLRAGNVIWDEQTQWDQSADLQDAHISRYINIYLRPRLKELLRTFLFEFNDEATRSLVVRKIAAFMEPQKAARAIYAYRVVCDETNNLDDDIENNILNSWLYIKPTKTIKWLRQKVILTNYNTSLEDLEF